MISVATFSPPEWNDREILRYARADKNDESILRLIEECKAESAPILSYKVSYSVLDIIRDDGRLSLSIIDTDSKVINKALSGCDKALLFAATVGESLDRLLRKYSITEPSRAVILHAIGAERVEALCDTFCKKFSLENSLYIRTRVSPGYGDIPLSMQRDIFALLDCPRKIGLTLNEALLMSPSKSVTAVAGIMSDPCENDDDKCSVCEKTNCIFRD